MVKRSLQQSGWLLIALLLTAAAARATDLSTQVDREQLTLDETLILTITAGSRDAVDLSALDSDFRIQSQRLSRELTVGDGGPRPVFQWRLELAPRRTGELVIPEPAADSGDRVAHRIQVEEGSAEPAELTPVVEDVQAPLAFMESQLSISDPWVREAIYFDLYLYYLADGVLFGQLPPAPPVPDTIVRTIGESERGRTTRAGHDYRYVKQRYVLVPQRAGRTSIPGITFNGALRFHDGDTSRRRNLRLTVSNQYLDVRSPPPQWPPDQPWLPARNLELSAEFEPALETWQTNLPLTYRVRTDARDVAASSLPELPQTPPPTSGLNSYRQQPELEERNTENGRLLATRIQTRTLLVRQRQSLELPAMEVWWWDLAESRIRRTRLPQRAITLAAGSPGADRPGAERSGAAPDTSSAQDANRDASQTRVNAETQPAPPSASPRGHALWWLLAVPTLILLAWLLVRAGPPVGRLQAWQARRALLRACRGSNAQQARAALRRLLQQWLQHASPSLAELRAQLPAQQQASLAPLLQELDQACYGARPHHWDGSAMAAWLRQTTRPPRLLYRARQHQALPPLYPDADQS